MGTARPGPRTLRLQQNLRVAASMWSRQEEPGSSCPLQASRQALDSEASGRVSVGLAIPGILVALIYMMCREAGQGFRPPSIWTKLWGLQSAVQPTGLAHRRLLVSP